MLAMMIVKHESIFTYENPSLKKKKLSNSKMNISMDSYTKSSRSDIDLANADTGDFALWDADT